METRDARSLPSKAQEALRMRAVAAVAGGRKQVEVAEIFGVTRQALGRWVKAWREGGEKALRGKRQGRPSGGLLDRKQARQIANLVVDKRPNQLKLPFYLWTREAVSQLIEQKLGIRLSIWTVGRYLARWGFTPQKPVRRAFEQSSEKVRLWLEERYPSIRQKALEEGAEIYWGDEMGLRSDHFAGRSFARRGHTPVIPTTGNRFGCNMISALTNKGRLSFMVFKDNFRVAVFLDFLRRLTRQAGRKVYLIVDGHSVHRSKAATKWVEKHHEKISLFFLPPYSPELNPDELLNQDVKANAVGRERPRNKSQLVTKLRSYLHSRQRQPHVVQRYFQGKKVQYAAL